MGALDGSGLVGRRLTLHPTAAVAGLFDVALQSTEASGARCSYGFPGRLPKRAWIRATDIEDLLTPVLDAGSQPRRSIPNES